MKTLLPFLLLLLYSPAVYAQSDRGLSDSIGGTDTLSYRKDFIHIYYSLDKETRVIYTDYDRQDGRQDNLPSSWTLGIGWTGDMSRHLTLSAGVEYSFKTVITDTIEVNDAVERTVFYRDELSYANIPVAVQFMWGHKFRYGLMGGSSMKFKLTEGGSSYRVRLDGSGTSEPQPGQRNFPFSKTSRYNQDVRIGAVLEYNFRHSRLRLMPVCRTDLFNTYRHIKAQKAVNYGLLVEYNF